jgi:hypothetical protein
MSRLCANPMATRRVSRHSTVTVPRRKSAREPVVRPIMKAIPRLLKVLVDKSMLKPKQPIYLSTTVAAIVFPSIYCDISTTISVVV